MTLRDDLPDRILEHPGLIRDYRPNAALILTNDSGLLLWCERIRYPGCWQFPQGGVDPGETPAEAVIREAGEELGLLQPARAVELDRALDEPLRYDFTVEVIEDFLERRGRSYVGQAQHYFLGRFIGDERELTLTSEGHNPEFCAWQWAGPELVETVPHFKRETLRGALRRFGLL